LNETKVGGSHGIVVLVVFVGDDFELSSPSMLREILSDVGFTFATSVNTDNCYEASVEWRSLSIKRSWGRILQQELFYSFPEVFKAELSLSFLISWCNEDGVGILLNILLSSELLSNSKDSFLDIR